MQKPSIKFCGLRRPNDIEAAALAGATYIGFVFFPKSPRHIETENARSLALETPPGIAKVALTVNANNSTLDHILRHVPIDMLQLHGKESPARVEEVRKRYGLPVMKAIGICDKADLAAIWNYGLVVDQLLIDAAPPTGSELPGGNGLSFDWKLLARQSWPKPWMLAGGLQESNVLQAIKSTKAQQIDVSSGVESAPGVKDHSQMSTFAKAARAAFATDETSC